MRLIYLDQRDLVLLARARKGKPDAGALRAIHDRLREFAIAGLLLAPLSESHCFEIWNIGNQRRRQDLAEVALCMSRRVAVAPLREIWRIEFGQLLAGLGAEPPRPRSIFGLGVLWALDGHEHEYPPEADEMARVGAELLFLAEPDKLELGPEELKEARRNGTSGRLTKARSVSNLLPIGTGTTIKTAPP